MAIFIFLKWNSWLVVRREGGCWWRRQSDLVGAIKKKKEPEETVANRKDLTDPRSAGALISAPSLSPPPSLMWPVAGWGTLYNKCKYTTSVLALTKTLRVIQKKDIPAHTVLSLTTFLQMVVMLHQCDATATARFLQLFVQ